MNRAGGKKLRQTTLDFVTSNKSELKKRKMGKFLLILSIHKFKKEKMYVQINNAKCKEW